MEASASNNLLILPSLPYIPKRIVSLVPSQTELLYDLGLHEEVVGITKFCVHPDKWFRQKQRVGGTKTVNTDLVKRLQPDLIIANKEENVKEQVEDLQQIAPVWMSDISNLKDALNMIVSIGKLVARQDEADKLSEDIKAAFERIMPVTHTLNTAYLIWKDPYMAAGGDTFIHDMLRRCGLINIFHNTPRYPEVFIDNISPENNLNNPATFATPLAGVAPVISSDNCQLLLLSSEPYPFAQKHQAELQSLLPLTKILLVDGEMFSWYGSRLLHSAQYFHNLIRQIQG